MPLISIIIPCYNAEEYVDRCLESLKAQTIGFENLEIILINDASTDQTLNKIEAWEKQYPEQIGIISLDTNMRQGYGRNIGIQNASADYIGFVDIDDWVDPDMYQQLFEKMIEGDYDIVRCKYVRDSLVNENPVNQNPRNDKVYHFISKEGFYIHDTPDTGNNGSYGGVWSGLYKKTLITNNQIWFPEKLTYEDNYWMSLISYYTKNEYILDLEMYHYFVNPHSTITTPNSPHHFDRLEIEMLLLEEYKKRGIFYIDHDNIEWNFIQMFYLNSLFIFFTRFEYIPDIINDMRKIVVANFPNYKENPNYSKLYMNHLVLLATLSEPARDLTDVELAVLKRIYVASLNAFS